MGASKRLAELMCQAYSSRYTKTKFTIVRFGNVISSSGSVIPTFKKQIKFGGPVTVTDQNVTRYFMSIEEAVSLVLQTISISKGGEVFLLDMGKPVKILELAIRMIHLNGLKYVVNAKTNDINKINIKFTGLRKGEKLNEELFLSQPSSTKNKKILMAKEKFIPLEDLLKILTKLEKDCSNLMPNKVIETLEKGPIDFNI